MDWQLIPNGPGLALQGGSWFWSFVAGCPCEVVALLVHSALARGGFALGAAGISFVELSLLFELLAGESLITEMTLSVGFRRERSLLVSAALVIVPAPLVATCSDGFSALCSAWWWCLQSREAFMSRHWRQFVAHLSSFSCFTFTHS